MSNIFEFTPLPLINGDFSLDLTSAPPTGWTVLGTILGFSYDTAFPYIEGGVSLRVASPQFTSNGIQSLPIPVTPGQLVYVSAAGRRGAGSFPVTGIADFADLKVWFLDINGQNVGPTIDLFYGDIDWTFLADSAIVPPGAVTCHVQFLVTNITTGGGLLATAEVSNITLGTLPLPYYMSLLTSQYQNSPKLKAWVGALAKPFLDAANCVAGMVNAFDLNTAIGPQLDVLGQILGVSRVLPFAPTAGGGIVTISAEAGTGSGYTIPTDVVTIVQSGASGGTAKVIGSKTVHLVQILQLQLLTAGTGYGTANGLSVTGGTGTGLLVDITASPASTILDDITYRTLLKAKVIFNQWTGQVDYLYKAWSVLFPGGTITILDNQNMTATITVGGNISPLMKQMIQQGMIIPRPQGVSFTYSFASSPLFGFDQNNLNLAGFDVGVWEA